MAEPTKPIPESQSPEPIEQLDRGAPGEHSSDAHPASQPAAPAENPKEPEPSREQFADQDPEAEASAKPSHDSVPQKIRRLSVPERIRLALTGTREERIALVRDSNKTISRAVIESPKVSDDEMELYAAIPDLAEEVYRLIAKNVSAMKSYGVVRALINNPRVPIDITLPLVKRLKARELRELKNNRNIPTALRNLAAKLLAPR